MMRRVLQRTGVKGIWAVRYGSEEIGFVVEDGPVFLATNPKLNLVAAPNVEPPSLNFSTMKQAAEAVVAWHEDWMAR